MKNKIFIWILIFLALAASLVIAYSRNTTENNYKNVELILDYNEVYKFCLNNGLDFDKTLSLFKEKQITTLAVNEDTLETLSLENKIFILSADNKLLLENFKVIYPGAAYILVPSQNDFMDLNNRLLFFFGDKRIKTSDKNKLLEIKGSKEELFKTGLGFSKSTVSRILNLGFNIILRPENKSYFNNKQIKKYWNDIYLLSGLKENNFKVEGIIFSGIANEALGYPAYLDESCKYLKNYSGFLGVIETYTAEQVQKGVNSLALNNPGKVVRVQAIGEAYLAKMNPDLAKEILLLGVKERNIRWAYLHLFNSAFYKQDILNTNLNFTGSLVKDLKDKGFKIAPANKLNQVNVPWIFVFIITLAVFAVSLAVICEWINLSLVWQFILIILGLFVLGILYKTGHYILARKTIALLSGLVFPTWGIITGIKYIQKVKLKLKSKLQFFTELKLITLTFLYISFISIIGGLIVQALLSDPLFLLQIDKFLGVKLLMILPPLAAFIWYITKGSSKAVSLKEFLSWPVRFWQFILGLIVLLAGVIYIWRTGNVSDAPQVTSERTLRILLDKWLGVRPRFKEIFLANPALVLSLGWLLKEENLGVSILLLIAAIGQVDIIDSFAHMHTSLTVTLIRVFYGLAFGWLFGILLWIVLKIYRRQ